ncbi:MAG: glycoside hydrolase family 44 protein [Acidobacteria bacterium]|nr:glycoside hydrolase family 44 protein [Acidobacteriota bacterium]
MAAVTVTVDANANRHTIDERIYGVAWADATAISDLEIPINRWGGNAMSRYNWVFSTANRCKDYYFYNIPDGVSSGDGSNGKSADDFIGMTRAAGAQPLMTIPMLSLLPKDRTKRCSYPQGLYANQEDFSTFEPVTCGNGRYDDGNGIVGDGDRILTTPDPNGIATSYSASHQGDWVQHMIDTWGDATSGGMKYYALDNEPGLWSFDHWDVHPDGATYDEVWSKMEEHAALIRSKDPNAIITGGEEWGWSGYFMSGLDMENGDDADRDAHGGVEWYDWMLDQFKAYDDANGTRLLDILTVHIYPQSGEFSDDVSASMQQLRNRSTRSLWDTTYVDESWIGGTFHEGKVQLIPRLKSWATRYPGTKIGITEYNWGAEQHINGATAQADILGIFGREAVDLATRWEVPPNGSHVYNAFKMYRNYDGAHSKFGDVSVSASGPNPDDVAVFAALRSTDNALTVMLVCKTAGASTAATVNLANFAASGDAERWQLGSSNVISQLADITVSSSSISLTLPAQTVTLLVIPGPPAPQAPTGFSASATSTTQVAATWTAAAGATLYEVYRSAGNSAFSLVSSTSTTSFNDTSLTANTTYLYRLRAVAGSAASPFTAIDPATTIIFTDDPLNVGMTAKAAHVTQLRTAVNAMRTAAGLTPQSFSDPSLSPGLAIKRAHLTELRTALDEARGAIGISAMAYTDPVITSQITPMKATHIRDLRDGVK